MDFTMVDVGDGPARVGDVATLLGRGAGGGAPAGRAEVITIARFAGWSGELQHAVLTSLGPRPPRIYR
jgi:alanine racemase